MSGVDAKKNEELLNGLFERLNERPEDWGDTAENLKAGAEVLFNAWRESTDENGEPINLNHLHLAVPACLLYSCYLENLIKGCLIAQHGSFQAAKSACETPWAKHDLRDLAAGTGIKLTNNQKMVLGTASAWVRWAGRYPIPLRREEFTIPNQLAAGKHPPPTYLQITERDELEPLCNELKSRIWENHMARLDKGPAKSST